MNDIYNIDEKKQELIVCFNNNILAITTHLQLLIDELSIEDSSHNCKRKEFYQELLNSFNT